MIGSLIGFIILFAYLLILLLALVAMPAILGQMLMLAFTKNDRRVTLLSLVIGVLVIAILSQLPLLGAVFMFVLALIGIGALVVAVYSLKSQPNQI
jgi:peptidoglycan/LPS O-acetylase OafA/YrhL